MAPAYWAMRAVAAHGEMVEVETLGPEPDWEAHCVGTPHGNLGTQALGKYRLRLFVRRDDLLPVTRREVAVVSADGTSLRLRPGVRVTRSKDARGGAVFAGEEGAPDSLARDEDEDAGVLRFTAPLPEDAVGLSYWPAPWTERVDDTALFPRARADGPGHELVGREPLTLGSGATVVPPSSTWWARLGRRQAGGRLVELTSGCAQVRAVVPTRRLRQVPENLGGVVGGLLCGDYFDDSWTVRAGAPVYSGHGQRIGEVLVEDTLRGPARSSPHGHRCFTVFPDGSRPTLTLCFAPDDVQQMEQEPGESAEDERP